MISFLLKGLFRDRQRSLFPFLMVTLGVSLTVLVQAWLNGVISDTIETNANFSTGHLKVVTRGYAQKMEMAPVEYGLDNCNQILKNLNEAFPECDWIPRMRFAAILDVPDHEGNTRGQAPVSGMGLDILNPPSGEAGRWNLQKALVKGRLPQSETEMLLSAEMSDKLGIGVGDTVTLLGTTVYQSMSIINFRVCGTLSFGLRVLDRGAVILPLQGAGMLLDFSGGATEIVGYFKDGFYHPDKAKIFVEKFNANGQGGSDFSPMMLDLTDQNNLSSLLDYTGRMLSIMIIVFVLIMGIVLWNSSLLGGIRRYQEFGIRLAMGESKTHLYWSTLQESLLVGALGSLVGTGIGLCFAWYLQKHGLDFSEYMKNSTVMMPTVYRARVTGASFYIGWLPGLVATLLGSALAGIGILKRNTAKLMKELQE
ncbi:MAG: hypothetical protein Kow0037_07690 [Calditrichia bacterium]